MFAYASQVLSLDTQIATQLGNGNSLQQIEAFARQTKIACLGIVKQKAFHAAKQIVVGLRQHQPDVAFKLRELVARLLQMLLGYLDECRRFEALKEGCSSPARR